MHGTPLGRFGMVVVAVVALLGCPRADPKSIAADALARVNSLAEEMCSCRNQACADRIQHSRDAWARAHREKYGDLPADAAMKAADEHYGNCMAKAMAGPPEEFSASGPAPVPAIETPIPDIVPLATPDALIAQAYRTASGDVFVSKIELRYITASGTFDPQYSEATITMSRRPKPEPPDDPTRPTGAPAREPTRSIEEMLAEHRCPQLRWSEGVAAVDDAACGGAIPLERPRCTVAAVAKRALTSGAPDKALGVIVLESGDKPGKRPRWLFTIDDPRRRVHFETHISDDCEVVVEKP